MTLGFVYLKQFIMFFRFLSSLLYAEMLKKKGDFKMLKYRIKRKFKMLNHRIKWKFELLKNHIRWKLKYFWIMIKLDFSMAIDIIIIIVAALIYMAISPIIMLLFVILTIMDLIKHDGKFVYMKKLFDVLIMVCDKINDMNDSDTFITIINTIIKELY